MWMRRRRHRRRRGRRYNTTGGNNSSGIPPTIPLPLLNRRNHIQQRRLSSAATRSGDSNEIIAVVLLPGCWIGFLVWCKYWILGLVCRHKLAHRFERLLFASLCLALQLKLWFYEVYDRSANYHCVGAISQGLRR